MTAPLVLMGIWVGLTGPMTATPGDNLRYKGKWIFQKARVRGLASDRFG